MVKERGADVVQVPEQREEAAPKLVIPNLQRGQHSEETGPKGPDLYVLEFTCGHF